MSDTLNYGRTRTISISSGKGGVGKTTTVANLAYQLSQQGKRILILDGDLGMANVDIMFGVRAQFGLQDVLSGKKFLEEIIVEIAPHIDLIPGGSGVYGLHDLSFVQKQSLLSQVSELDKTYDYMLVDTAPGISDNVLYMNAAAQEVLVVVTPDPSSITDAYALIKVLNLKHHENRFSILCNQVKSEQEALRIYKRLSDVADQFLCVSLDFKGWIPLDLNLRQATKAQQLISRSQPGTDSSQRYGELAEKIVKTSDIFEVKGTVQFFWEQLSGVA